VGGKEGEVSLGNRDRSTTTEGKTLLDLGNETRGGRGKYVPSQRQKGQLKKKDIFDKLAGGGKGN